MGDLVDRVTRKNQDLVSELPLTISAQYGLINQNEFFDKRVASKDVSGYYLIENGEFAYNKSTSTDAPWGAIKRLDRYENGVLSTLYIVFGIKENNPVDSDFLVSYYSTNLWHKGIHEIAAEGARNHGLLNIAPADFFETELTIPQDIEEQKKIGKYFEELERLITLHQRKQYTFKTSLPNTSTLFYNIHNPSSVCEFICKKGVLYMQNTIIKSNILFCDYYKQWISVYKEGAIRPVTMSKYNMAHQWLVKLIPELVISDLDRITYQKLLNDYATEHERQTTMDFHHHLKCAILDAVDEGLILHDPTRKAIIKGKTPREKKTKFLNQYELHKLLDDLNLTENINMDWLILLVAKTGMRFSEALALTPKDFNLSRQLLSVSKTWDYKGNGGFLPTKNESSVRKIPLDWQTVIQFAELIKQLPEENPIFVTKKVYNSTVNSILAKHCRNAEIPVISIHGLRHTHASLLLFAGVSIASVARRLGHSNITTTQKTYLHIIQELESKDIDIIMRSLSNLNS